MKVTREMRLQRALEYLEAEKREEEKSMRALEGKTITEVIILRNKKALYLAEVEQMIRKAREEMEEYTFQKEMMAEVRT